MSQFEIVVMSLARFNTQFKVQKNQLLLRIKLINHETFWQQEQLYILASHTVEYNLLN